MTDRYPLADQAAALLAEDAENAPRCTLPRAALVNAIALTMRAETQRRARRRTFRMAAAVGALAFAAALLLAFGVRAVREREQVAPVATATTSSNVDVGPAIETAALDVHGSGSIMRGSVTVPLEVAAHVQPLDRLTVATGEATITFDQGSRLAVHEGTEVLVEGAGLEMRTRLARGSVDAEVVRLSGAQRFVIQSDDELIEVHGTAFTVERVAPDPACADGTPTRVRVREGIVSVRSHGAETLVRPGEHWPADCDGRAPDEVDAGGPGNASPPPTALAAPTHTTPQRPTPSAATSSPAPSHDSSELAAQNDLFRLARERKRTGDIPGAIAALDDLLARYPRGVLAQGARADRMRMLQTVDRERARVAARDYLTQHPNGFARADAETILAAP